MSCDGQEHFLIRHSIHDVSLTLVQGLAFLKSAFTAVRKMKKSRSAAGAASDARRPATKPMAPISAKKNKTCDVDPGRRFPALVPKSSSSSTDVTCGRCGEMAQPGGVRWAFYDRKGKAEGSACNQCWRVFVQLDISDDDTLDWHEHCRRCFADGDFDLEQEEAAQILEHIKDASFPIHDVAEGDEFLVEIRRPFIALPRADFRKQTGKNPSEVNVAEQDLKNELGQTFKGVLLQHPNKPWLEYSLIHRLGVKSSKILLDHAKQCHKGTAEAVMNKGHAAFDNTGMVTKLRNCVLTRESLEETLKQPFLRSPTHMAQILPDASSSRVQQTAPSIRSAPVVVKAEDPERARAVAPRVCAPSTPGRIRQRSRTPPARWGRGSIDSSMAGTSVSNAGMTSRTRRFSPSPEPGSGVDIRDLAARAESMQAPWDDHVLYCIVDVMSPDHSHQHQPQHPQHPQ